MGGPKAVLTPQFLWAQRKDQIFLTLDVPNVKKETAVINLTDEGKVYFKGFGGNLNQEVEYILDIMLLKGIKKDESKAKITARSIVFKIVKADSGPYWERLLKVGGRNVHCKIDWDNWLDEDEEDNESGFGSQFGNKDHEDMDFIGDGESSEEDEAEVAPTNTETTL